MIRLENIFIKLNENKTLIGNINIFIPSGSLVSIIGSPGAGKTKLFKVFGLEEKATSGNLYILGKNVNKLNRNELTTLHSEISLVYESNDLIKNLGVEDNITMPLISTNKQREEIEIAVNELVSWLNINHILEKDIIALSKYEEKLVQFARAIITRPRVLLLDNFFSGFNNDLEKKISYLLLALKKIGTTIILFRNEGNKGILEYNETYKIDNASLIKL